MTTLLCNSSPQAKGERLDEREDFLTADAASDEHRLPCGGGCSVLASIKTGLLGMWSIGFVILGEAPAMV